MKILRYYISHRYFCKRQGWWRTWVRWLWLDALLWGTARYATYLSPLFRRYCHEVDQLFVEQHELAFSMTKTSGLDCWIDPYWSGMSPQDAVDSEVEHWD